MSKIPDRKEDGVVHLTASITAPYWIVDDKDFVMQFELKDGQFITIAMNKETVEYYNGHCIDKEISITVFEALLKEYKK